MDWGFEAMPEDTSSFGHVALACQTHLQELLKKEESQENAAKAGEGYMYWASRQSAEFIMVHQSWSLRRGSKSHRCEVEGCTRDI